MNLLPVKYQAPRFNGFLFEFGRINVILGANGSGKSRLLSELRDAVPGLLSGTKAVYIEGGRAIKLEDVLKLDAKNFQHFDKLESAFKQWDRKRTSSLADRVFDALVVLEKRELALKAQHSDAVEAWNATGRSGPYPTRPRAPLARLFELFTELFPQIELSYDYDARRMSAHKNGQKYGPSTLSDGEKQVFSVLADLIEIDEAHRVIIADEPELNLHPELAERLWTLVENEFPDKLFVYATHSINFALRENVEKVFVLSCDAESIAAFRGLDELPRDEARAFLGGLPGILSTNSVVVTEGHDKSFDALFYRWLLGNTKVEVFPAGACTDVVAVVGKAGIWNKVSSKITLRGVTDADFRDAQYLEALRARGVTVLQLHEAESYLCLPEVIVRVAERIGSQEVRLTAAEVEEAILASLAEQRIAIAARRVFAVARIALAVGVEKKVLAAADSRDAVLAAMERASREEVAKAATTLDPARLAELLDSELARVDRVVQERDATGALSLLPAKPLIQTLAQRSGCKSAADLMRSLRHNFRPEDFPLLTQLKSEIMSDGTLMHGIRGQPERAIETPGVGGDSPDAKGAVRV